MHRQIKQDNILFIFLHKVVFPDHKVEDIRNKPLKSSLKRSYYFCRYPIFKELDDTKASTVVKCTKEDLVMFGTVCQIVCDNGPCFQKAYTKTFEMLGTSSIQHLVQDMPLLMALLRGR